MLVAGSRRLKDGDIVECVNPRTQGHRLGDRCKVFKENHTYKIRGKRGFEARVLTHISEFKIVEEVNWIVSNTYPESYNQLIVLPDGSYCYTVKDVIKDEEFTKYSSNPKKLLHGTSLLYPYIKGLTPINFKGQTRDGVPFGKWTVDFGD